MNNYIDTADPAAIRLMFIRTIAAPLLGLFIATPALPSGAEESQTSTTGAGTPVVGTPFVDHIHSSPSAYHDATGTRIGSFSEPPMLAALVASGDLPPLDERIPQQPQVLRPAFEVGPYGGTLRDAAIGSRAGQAVRGASQSMAISAPFVSHESGDDVDHVASVFLPNIPRTWILSDDGTELTVRLRRGMRWSDGAPFTTDDFTFFYEYILLNEELRPRFDCSNQGRYCPGGEPMTIVVSNEYTVTYHFGEPYFRVFASWARVRLFAPKHFLCEYHIGCNPNANSLAAASGYETWVEAFRDYWKGDVDWLSTTIQSEDLPTTDIFVLSENGSDRQRYERNRYYWKVDTLGNQLPYLDGIEQSLLQDRDAVKLMALSGEIDWPDFFLFDIDDLEVVRAEADSGEYRVLIWSNLWTSTALAIAFNYTHQDPVKRIVFQDRRFRQALSSAIDRERISTEFYGGLVSAHTPPVGSHWTGYEPWMTTHFADYDHGIANHLLDEMQLLRGTSGTRLLPNGKPLIIVGAYWQDSKFKRVLEQVISDWAHVGVELVPRQMSFVSWHEEAVENNIDVTFADTNGGAELFARERYPSRLVPPWHHYQCCPVSGYPWAQWFWTGGTTGEAPPPEIRLLFRLAEDFLAAEYGSPRYEEAAHKLVLENVEQLYNFGTVSSPPLIGIVSHRVGNVPDDGALILPYGVQPFNVDTIFVKD